MQATLTEEQETTRVHTAAPGPRSELLRRARGTLLLALTAFVAAQIGLGVFIEECRPELRDPIFEIKYRQLSRLLQRHHGHAAPVVFLGSSMSANGMKAQLAEAPLTASLGRPVVSYNLATNGGGPITHLVYVQRLLRRGVRPEMVVLEVSPLLLSPGQASMDFRRFPADVLERQDLEVLERYNDQLDLRDEWWQSQIVPAYGHRLMILNQLVPTFVPFNEQIEVWPDVDDHGWRGREALSPEEHNAALMQIGIQLKDRLANFKIDDVPLKGLRELTDLLAKERIQTVLVVMPEGPFLRSLYARGSTAPVMAEFAALGRQHGFVLIDAHTWYGEDSFVDSYHLHEEAADGFTERLVREALVPALRPRGGVASSGR